jgi:hypothetical protein
MVLAQPLSETTGIEALAPISELFTFPVSATFFGGTQGYFNLTITSANTSKSRSFLLAENFGTGSITLSGKGALSVDNVLTETVRWLTPASLDVNMTNTTMTFHTAFAMQYPEKDDSLGFPLNAYFSLHRTGKNISAPNGTKLWTEWEGSQTVRFVESGALESNLFIDNLSLSYPSATGKGNTLNATNITGVVPAYIEIGSEEATSSVRNNDWVVTLTFALLLFAVLDLGSYENRNNTQSTDDKEDGRNKDIKKRSKKAHISLLLRIPMTRGTMICNPRKVGS